MWSVITTQLWHYSEESTILGIMKMNEQGSVPLKLFIEVA